MPKYSFKSQFDQTSIDAIYWDGTINDGTAADQWIMWALTRAPKTPGAMIRVDDHVHCWSCGGVEMIAHPGSYILHIEKGHLEGLLVLDELTFQALLLPWTAGKGYPHHKGKTVS